MSTQYFLTEMMVDFLTYFVFWLILTLILNRIWKIKIPKRIVKLFWISSAVFLAGFVFLSNELDDQYWIKRDFEVKIFDSGCTIFEFHSTNREKYQTASNNHYGE